MFLQVCVCPPGGWAGTLHPGTWYTPEQVHPPGPGTSPRARYTPWDQVCPQDQIHTPWDQVHHRDQVHTLGPGAPPEQCMLGDTGNKWAVHILLECILVCFFFVCAGSWMGLKEFGPGGARHWPPLPPDWSLLHELSCAVQTGPNAENRKIQFDDHRWLASLWSATWMPSIIVNHKKKTISMASTLKMEPPFWLPTSMHSSRMRITSFHCRLGGDFCLDGCLPRGCRLRGVINLV